MTAAGATPQAAPRPGTQDVWPLVIADVRRGWAGSDAAALQAELIADMEAREAAGLTKYGTRLQAGNGRDALLDAYQEALDCAVYMRQHIAEGEAAWPEYMRALDLVGVLKRRLAWRGKATASEGA